MPVVISLGGQRATIDDGAWTSDDPNLQEFLNEVKDEDLDSGADPWPDMTQARDVLRRYGGQIVDEGQPPRSRLGRVH